MNNFKEWLNDFKYMSRTNKIQIVVAGVAIAIGIVGFGLFLVKNFKNGKQEEFVANLSDYFAYSYQETGDLSVVNLNSGEKVLSKIKISNNAISKEDKEKINNSFLNPYQIVDVNNKMYVLNYNGEIVELSYSKDKVKELRRIKVEAKAVDFKIYENNIYVSYLDSTKVDIFDLTSGNKVRTFEVTAPVTAFELADNMLYIATKDGIEVINTVNASDKKTLSLDSEFASTDILLSKDKEEFKVSTIKAEENTTNKEDNASANKEDKKDSTNEENKSTTNEKKEVNTLYVLNNFANDNKNSVVIKMQEGVAVDILELEKENPIDIFEGDKYLYVTCRGLENDKDKDSMVVINKKNFKIKKRVVLENAPNSVSLLDENTAFVSHDNGEVVKVNLINGTSEGIFKIINTKNSIIKKYSK